MGGRAVPVSCRYCFPQQDQEGKMIRYIGKRLLQMIPILFAVAVLIFRVSHFSCVSK